MNLGGRFVLGSAYLAVGQVLTNFANFFLRIAIARLLGPAEFGVYAFCFAINEFINIVGAFSMSFALIQSREVDEQDYDTAFAICAGLGLIGMAVAAAVAPALWVYRSREAAGILLLMGVARMLRLLWQVPEARLERGLRYARVTAITTFVAVVPNVAAVGLAWAGLGAFSLGLRDVLVTVLLFVLSVWASGYRFRGRVERSSYRRLMAFGRPMFVSRSIEILMERLDNLAVGLLMGNRAAGLYHQSRELAESGFIATRSVERVSLNLYARLQDDPVRLARSWALVNYFLTRVMMAGVAVLLVYPQEVVQLLLGKEWLEVVPLLRWLALYAGLFPIFHNVKNLCYGLGEVHRMVRVRVVQAVVFLIAVGYASWIQSLEAMAAGLLLTTLVALGYAWKQSLDLVASPPLLQLATPFLVLAATVAAMFVADSQGAHEIVPWWALPLLPAILYVLALLAVERSQIFRELRYLASQVRRPEDGAPPA